MNLTSNPVTFGKKDYKKNMITQMTQSTRRKNNVLLERALITTSSSGGTSTETTTFTVRVSAQGT